VCGAAVEEKKTAREMREPFAQVILRTYLACIERNEEEKS